MDITVKDFRNQKKQVLLCMDASRKGDIDEPIKDLIKTLNDLDNFVTTSSCSGRVILITQDCNEIKKQDCKWVFNSHDLVKPDDLISHADPNEGDLVLKFEPFILHVQCRTLDSAKMLQKCALESGFRNSGIVIGGHNKITLGVRSAHGLEVPLSSKGVLLVSAEYLNFLTETVNEKMEENKIRTERFKRWVDKIVIGDHIAV